MDDSTNRLAVICRQERTAYQKTGEGRSPSCVELFRRAFNGHQEAWGAVHSTFEPLVQSWVGVQKLVEPEDVVQDAFLQFFRYAPEKPTLVSTDQLGPLLAYLKQTTKTSLLMALRKEKKRKQQVSVDSVATIFASGRDNTEADLRVALGERIDDLLGTDKERLVFHARFVLNIGPKDIYAGNEETFDDYNEVATIIQRLTRRLRKDPIILDLKGARQNEAEGALLAIELLDETLNQTKDAVDENGKDNAMKNTCQYGEVALLDYVTGIADAEMRAGIEKSPACMHAAAELRHDLSPILTTIEQLGCPAPAQLISYQERKMNGTERLVLYRHISTCQECTEELELLQAIDTVGHRSPASAVRRLVEAVFQPMQALPQPLRGKPQTYKAGELQVNLTISRDLNQRYRWRLRGQLRDKDGRKYTEIDEILLVSRAAQESTYISTSLNAQGSFVFTDIMPGAYDINILKPEAELVLPAIAIGEQELANLD